MFSKLTSLFAIGLWLGCMQPLVAQVPIACECTLYEDFGWGNNAVGSFSHTAVCSVANNACSVAGSITWQTSSLTGWTWNSGVWGMPNTAISPPQPNQTYNYGPVSATIACGTSTPIGAYIATTWGGPIWIAAYIRWTCPDF